MSPLFEVRVSNTRDQVWRIEAADPPEAESTYYQGEVVEDYSHGYDVTEVAEVTS